VTASVVVPTRDRAAGLARCLDALAKQQVESLQVVVVDDGSRDRAALDKALERLPTARCLHTVGAGPAAARNLGARAATGDVICFTDDDCEPAPEWAGLLATAAGETGVAAGRTVAPGNAATPVVAAQVIIDHLLLDSLGMHSITTFAPSCNLAVSAELAARLPFDERFPDAAGEDREWSARAVAAGAPPRYVRDAIVVHRQRLNTRGFVRQQYRYGRGAARFRRVRGERRVLSQPSSYARLVRAGFERGPRVGALVVAAQVVTAAGVTAEAITSMNDSAAG
jgi:glycosyltransferase involved in cell wall biosynthesis